MIASRFEYSAYGLALTSDRALPGLRGRSGDGVSVHIRFDGPTSVPVPPGMPFHAAGPEKAWHTGENVWLMRYENALDGHAWSMEVREGRQITVTWSARYLLEDIPCVLVGAGLAAAMQLQNRTVLHAAVVAVDGAALALMGVSGAGKSTTCAALVSSGCALVADDLAVLVADGGDIAVAPGAPRMRMFPDSARAAGWDGELPRVFSHAGLDDKRYADLPPESFCADVSPLTCVYVLEPRSKGAHPGAPRIHPVAPRRALGLLLDNIYRAPFLDAKRKEQAAKACARLAGVVPVRAVSACDDLAMLPALVDAIRRDAAAVIAREGPGHAADAHAITRLAAGG